MFGYLKQKAVVGVLHAHVVVGELLQCSQIGDRGAYM